MTDADDLLSKADALLARWRAGTAAPRPPADYPVLNDVVEVPVSSSAQSAVELRSLEERIQSRVLEALEPRIKAYFDEPLRTRIEDISRKMAVQLAADARQEIISFVRDAVKTAVRRELGSQRDLNPGGS